jgi:membrane protease YdiL (CAAX protease family)
MILAALAALAGVLVFDGLYESIVVRVTGKPMPSQLIAPWIGAAAQQESWLTFIALGFVAPAAEEILFRGLLFGAVRKWLSGAWTIVVTAAVFAMIHLQLVYFVPVFAVGLMLGWARHKSGGLLLPITLHCLNNSTALLIAMARGGAS